MRKHLTNATFGVLDYVSYPVAMLLVAPIVLRRLGAAEYGLWILCASVVSAGGILASGFCDAGMQRIARLRGAQKIHTAAGTVRALLTINLISGALVAVLVWFAAPIAAKHVAAYHITSMECVYSLRMSGTWILLRALESVGVTSHRAFEEYRGSVQISVGVRLLTLAAAALLATTGYRVPAILIATGVALALGVWLQFRGLRKYLGDISFRPAFDRKELRLLVRPGVFVWFQSACGVVFGQLDRILLAVSFGAAALAPYALCVQFAAPIFGLSASGLQFLFPLISRKAPTLSLEALQQMIAKSFALNVLVVAVPSIVLLAFGRSVIRIWAGSAISEQSLAILPGIVFGTALWALGVTGTYSMQALGRFRTAALLNIGGRLCALFLLVYLLRHRGIEGVVLARVFYGATALLVYVPLLRGLWLSRIAQTSPGYAVGKMQEGQS
ncbi:MAG TPA: oligosaccharide flippase family protein [Acidobacteriaceae bacterium]|nr:oligosaccharide flippase family protein [Acidobacteriaceae bacterium]